MLKPDLVFDDKKKLHMQVRLGNFTATCPLPEEMASYTEAELQPFFDHVVPEMTKNLLAMQAEERSRALKKAKRNDLVPKKSS